MNMDYTGTVDGVAFEGGTAAGATIELGENNGYIGATGDYKALCGADSRAQYRGRV